MPNSLIPQDSLLDLPVPVAFTSPQQSPFMAQLGSAAPPPQPMWLYHFLLPPRQQHQLPSKLFSDILLLPSSVHTLSQRLRPGASKVPVALEINARGGFVFVHPCREMSISGDTLAWSILLCP